MQGTVTGLRAAQWDSERDGTQPAGRAARSPSPRVPGLARVSQLRPLTRPAAHGLRPRPWGQSQVTPGAITSSDKRSPGRQCPLWHPKSPFLHSKQMSHGRSQ